MPSKHFFLITLLSFATANAYAGVYKWTDAEGKTHYSQSRPSAGIKSESLHLHGRKPHDSSKDISQDADNSEAANNQAEDNKNTEQQTPESKQPQQPENKLSAKQSKAACLSARKNLAQMKSAGRVRKKDATGNISYLSDQQKQSEIKKAKKVIKKYCK